MASIALYESMRHFHLPLCTFLPHPNQTPITCSVTIIDLADVSIGSMWTLRSHLSEASKLATANYPETLSTIAIINAPSFFPTIWNWIKVAAFTVFSWLLFMDVLSLGLVRRGHAQQDPHSRPQPRRDADETHRSGGPAAPVRRHARMGLFLRAQFRRRSQTGAWRDAQGPRHVRRWQGS
jgi:hypothetical protein